MNKVMMLAAVMTVWMAGGAELYVYAEKGTVKSGARELPVWAVRQDRKEVVLGMYGADALTKAACGWYRVRPAAEPGTNVTVTGRSYVIEGCEALERIETRPAGRGKRAGEPGIRARIAAIRLSGSNVTERCVDALAEELARRAGQ